MGINIDKFLEGLAGEEQEKKVENSGEEEQEKIDLKFEDELKQKISNIQQSVGEKDFEFLVKAYNEMKNFDETLPNKLFSVNEVSGKALTDLSSKYSKGYLEAVTNNMKTLSTSIQENLNKVEKELDENNFQMAMSYFSEAQRNFGVFPKEFATEKAEVGKAVRTVEVKINERFLTYKRDEVKKVKLRLSQELKSLRDNLTPGNIHQIEEKINSVNLIMDKTPKVFYSDLVLERTQVAKIMINAQDFLKREYERDFNEKKQEIFRLFDKFHKYRLAKDANSALITYDEMIILFGKLPDIFLAEKTQIFERINKVFESLNNLLMSSNMSVFVKTYEYGKTLDEVRDYIEHVNLTKSADLNVLIDLKKRIGQIPISFKPEVVELITSLDKCISTFEKTPQRPMQNKPVEDEPLRQEFEEQGIQTYTEEKNEEEKKDTEQYGNSPNPELVTSNNSKDNVKSNIVLEINDCYKHLLDSEDRSDALRYAKKIHFYLDMLKVNDSMKKEISSKVERALKSKS